MASKGERSPRSSQRKAGNRTLPKSTKKSSLASRAVKPKQFSPSYYFFNENIQVLEYDEADTSKELAEKSINAQTRKLIDPWTSEEEKAGKKTVERENMRLNEAEKVKEIELEEDKEEFESFLRQWEEARAEQEEIEKVDEKCMEKLKDVTVAGASSVFNSSILQKVFKKYRQLELEVRIFKNIKAVRWLRIFVSKSSVQNVKKFLKFQEELFETFVASQKDIGLTGKASNLPKMHSSSRQKLGKVIKFSSKEFKDEWLEVDLSPSFEDLSDDDEPKKKKKKITLPYRFQGYIRLFSDLHLEWKKLMRAMVENYLKCINTATVQALMNFGVDFNYRKSDDPLAMIRSLFERPMPKSMLRKPFIPPSLSAQFTVVREQTVDEHGTVRTKSKKHIKPLLRTDRYYSRNRTACDRDCPYHEGKLFLLLINLGKPQVVKYCLEHGFKSNMKICGTRVKQIRWVEDFHPDQFVDDTFGIRVSNYEVTTPLATAAELVSSGGDPEIVRILLSKGAKPLVCNDLAIRQCASSISAVSEEKARRGSFKFHLSEGPVLSRRLISAAAFKELKAQWQNALEEWDKKNANAGSFKQKVAETKAQIHLKYYFDVAHLSQALLDGEWGAVDAILGFVDPSVGQNDFRMSVKGGESVRGGRLTLKNNKSSNKLLKNWKLDHPQLDDVIQLVDGKTDEVPLQEICSVDGSAVEEKAKILDFLYTCRKDRTFCFSQNRLLRTLRTLDRMLVAALQSSSKNSDNSLLQDASGNYNYVMSILVLLEFTRFNVDNKRLKYLVALLVKSMTEFKPGDKVAIMYMLKNEQIRSFLKLQPRVYLADDVFNVVNLVKDKKLQIVLDVPAVKQRKRSIQRRTVSKTLGRNLAGISRNLKRKSRIFGRRKSNSRNQVSFKKMTKSSKNSDKASIATGRSKNTVSSDLSKSTKASSVNGATDVMNVEIEPNLRADLLVKASANGFLEFIKELLSVDSNLELLVLYTMMESALRENQRHVIKFLFDLTKEQFGSTQFQNHFFITWTKVSLQSDVCCYSFLEMLVENKISLQELIKIDEEGPSSIQIEDSKDDLNLFAVVNEFLLETVISLQLTNNPRNDFGNQNRKKSFDILKAALSASTLKLNKENAEEFLEVVAEQEEPIWARGFHEMCEYFEKEFPGVLTEFWVASFMKKILRMPRPQRNKGRLEMLDLLEFFDKKVESNGTTKMQSRIRTYMKKIEQDVNNPRRRRR